MKKYIFYFLCLHLLACNSNAPKKMSDKAKADNTTCTTLATVKDFKGLDGCSFLFVLDNGDKYLPGKIADENFVFKDQQRIKFGYKVMPDMMSICMTESKTIEVTCLELLSEPSASKRPAKKECIDTETPLQTAWMQSMIEKHIIRQVSKYDYRGGFAYVFKSDLEFFLVDCQGTQLCQGILNEEKACVGRYIESVASGKKIWQKM